MTQEQLAKKARLSLRTVQSVEKGLACRRDTIRKLLRGLGIPFEDWREVFLTTSPATSESLAKLDRPILVPTPRDPWQDLGMGQETFADSNP
jgi:transcriptional regulator with XRE-family HTH domain